MWQRTGALVLAVTACLGVASAQDKPSVGDTLTKAGFRIEYIRILKEFIGGDADRAVADLARLPPAATHRLNPKDGKPWGDKLVTQRDFTLTPNASEALFELSELQMSLAAVMVETEAAFLENRGDLLYDRLQNAELWLDSVEQLFNRGRWADFRRRWSLAVGRKALWSAAPSPASKILRDACALFPDDAALFLAYGHAQETTAFVAGATTPVDRSAAGAARRRALSESRTALERALRLDSGSNSSIEARVRLAHIHAISGEDGRAAPLLEQVLSRSAPQPYQYLSSIMLGDIDARAGRLDQATTRYIEARQIVPGAQNVYVAHAHALRAADRHEEAAGVLREMLGRSQRIDDPWVQYSRGFDPELTRLEPLRAFVRGMMQ